MSDERLRELERRWAATRDPGDEARLLAERLRARRVKRSRLELAAYVGHGPAIEALGEAAPVGDHVPWHRWRDALDETARGPLVRLTMAFILGHLRRKERPIRPEALEAIEAVRRWADCPCEEHTKVARSVAAELEQRRRQDPSSYVHAVVVERAMAAMNTPISRSRGALDPLAIGLRWASGLGQRVELDDEERAGLAGLVAWALGPAHVLEGAPAGDEARWLAARLKRGELVRERLEVAAWTGSELALGLLGTSSAERPADRCAWMAGLRRWHPSWTLRVLARLAAHAFGRSSWRSHAEWTSGGDEVVRRNLNEIRTHHGACGDLRRWADDADRAPHGLLEELRVFDADPLVEVGEIRERRRLLIAVMEHCAQKTLPDEPLIQRVVAFHDATTPPPHPTIEETVIDWALRYDAGSSGERRPAPPTVSAPGTP